MTRERLGSRWARSSSVRGLTMLWIGLALAGCSSQPASMVNQDEAENLRKIQTAYDAATRKLGRPPAKMEELQPHLVPLGNPEEILRSPRDNQPYVIFWKVDPRKTQAMPPPMIAHEKEGAKGTRYVLTVMGVMPMSDEEFAKVAPKK